MGAVTAAAFPVAGTILTAAEYNKLPRGVVYYNTITANQTGVSATVDLTNFSATWTAVAGRLYRTTVYVPEVQQLTAGGTAVFRITDSAGTVAQFSDMTMTAAGFFSIHAVLIESPAAGSVTRKARASTSGGTISLFMAATSPGIIMTEDIGAS